ncbi:MAG TPA: TetR/AcrR family transcriptional regulator [Gemmatimonadaceae bacterium]|nr:TetR/AcrR family transcriptional regulator [Gemmatimonadaceae bacterium]
MDVQSAVDKREAIEDAALALFVEQGFHGTTVPEIARRAGVGTGTLYLYHASKDELLNALLLRWCRTLALGLAGATVGADTPRAVFAGFWKAAVDFSEAYPEAWAFMMQFHDSPYIAEETRQEMASIKAPVVAMFCAGVEQGVFKPLPPELLHAVCVGIMSEVRQLSVLGCTPVTAELWQAAEAMAWEAISCRKSGT